MILNAIRNWNPPHQKPLINWEDLKLSAIPEHYISEQVFDNIEWKQFEFAEWAEINRIKYSLHDHGKTVCQTELEAVGLR